MRPRPPGLRAGVEATRRTLLSVLPSRCRDLTFREMISVHFDEYGVCASPLADLTREMGQCAMAADPGFPVAGKGQMVTVGGDQVLLGNKSLQANRPRYIVRHVHYFNGEGFRPHVRMSLGNVSQLFAAWST